MKTTSADRDFMCNFSQRDRIPGCNQYYRIKSPGELVIRLEPTEKSKMFLVMNIVALSPIDDNLKSVRSRGGVSCR